MKLNHNSIIIDMKNIIQPMVYEGMSGVSDKREGDKCGGAVMSVRRIVLFFFYGTAEP